MKPEYPELYAKASMLVATPLIGLVAIFYVASAISQPASEVYGIGMAAFGVTAGLSAICFNVHETVHGASKFWYAGEKFLHSSMLLVQTMMLVYLDDFLVGSTWLSNHLWLGTLLRMLPRLLLSFISGAAAITWYLGFDVLDSLLWQNWRKRVEDINEPAIHGDAAKNTENKDTS